MHRSNLDCTSIYNLRLNIEQVTESQELGMPGAKPRNIGAAGSGALALSSKYLPLCTQHPMRKFNNHILATKILVFAKRS